MKKTSVPRKFIKIRNRSLAIDSTLVKKHEYMVYNGKKSVNVTIERSMYGIKFGALALTKKLGKKIHNSERNRKRKNKKKNKK